MKRMDLRGTSATTDAIRRQLPRAAFDITAAVEAVTPIIDSVIHEGASAIKDCAERFDHVRPDRLKVPADQIRAALDGLDPAVRGALEVSIEHNRAGHTVQLPTTQHATIIPGGTITQRWVPVQRAGVYVPGGLAVYPSSVVMNVVPMVMLTPLSLPLT